ncbi:hypothetical protein [Acidiphilium acidophilum]|uniref:Glycosyltransferase n=1 Tax=Acidiphilium acidophilum TaxID=76588 RepID=A0AAW9DM74_ACIAO|nr:hypothetical protein [Acidiphilium acidophilum]MDX5930100.1 hypothetical protein [Acidiphilium acidophilum]
MFYNLKRRMGRWRLERSIHGVFETPPIRVSSAPWAVVSMVGDADIAMYLLAIKTFYRKLGAGKIVAIVSRNMKEDDLDKIKYHVSGIEIQIIDEIEVSGYQRGGCWERLIYILNRLDHEFVIQLDCDTITIGNDIDEIIKRVESNVSFAYADGNRPVMSMAAAGIEARLSKSNYVGLALERSFCDWPKADHLMYCRGSAAIAGFAKGSGDLNSLEFFYTNMKMSLQDRWQEWGTEQCASNFMIANSANVSMLPFPAYATYPGCGSDREVKMFHFLGSVRYRDGYYGRKGKAIINGELRTESRRIAG